MTACWSPSGTRTGRRCSASMKKPGGFAVWYEPFTCLPHPEALQPAHGPLRAGRHRLRPVRRLAGQERLSHGLDDVPRRGVPRDLRRTIRRARRRRASRSIRSSATWRQGSARWPSSRRTRTDNKIAGARESAPAHPAIVGAQSSASNEQERRPPRGGLSLAFVRLTGLGSPSRPSRRQALPHRLFLWMARRP